MVNVSTSCNVALKEWAVTIRAMALGDQIIIVRKGGIHQDDKELRIIHPSFLLFPTYAHQKLVQKDLITPLEDSFNANEIEFQYWAKVTDVYELRDSETLSKISSFHHWTEEYVKSRFHWRPSQALTVALLRLFKLEGKMIVPRTPAFSGCKSWVELDDHIPIMETQPVLSVQEYIETSTIAGKDGTILTSTKIRESLSGAENVVL